MQVYPPANPELVPEVQGPFYDDAQVRKKTLGIKSIFINRALGYIKTFKMDYAKG